MEHTQFNFSPSESRLCDFFGKRARARRQERRSRRRGGQEQAQQNVSATEYVDQEEDTEVTVETLNEKRDKIQENMNVAGDNFKSIKEKMKVKGYDEAAQELGRYYQEEYLKQVEEHSGELYNAYEPVRAKHEEAQENPIQQKQITKQCGRCYYYRWILVRRQKEMDEHERTLDGLLDDYDTVVDKLTRNLSREADRVENDYYRVVEVEVKKTDPATGKETIEVEEINIQEKVEETITDIEKIVDNEEAKAQNESVEGDEGVEVNEIIDNDVKSVEEVAEELVENGQEIGETVIENVEEEIKHNFLDQLKEPEAQTILEAGVEAGNDDVQIMNELSKKYEVNLTNEEKVAVRKEIAKFKKAREIREKIEKDYGPEMEKFSKSLGKFVGYFERGKWSRSPHKNTYLPMLRYIKNAIPRRGTGKNGKFTLEDLVNYKQVLVDKKISLRDEDFGRGKKFNKKGTIGKLWHDSDYKALTKETLTQVRTLDIWISKITDDKTVIDVDRAARERNQRAQSS